MNYMATGTLPSSMRAAVITAPRTVEIREVPMPALGPGDVLIRMEGCGLCGSNQPVWQGRPWFDYPLAPGAPGHEGWGRVAAVGAYVTEVAVGDRVAALSYRALAEYDVARQDRVVRLPVQLQDQDMPGEPLACAMNVLRRSDIRPGHTVAVVGVGFLGAVLVQLARRAGARVVAVSRRPFALELARSLGASHCFALEDASDIASQVDALTEGRGCDRVIEAAGVQSTLDLSSRLVRVRGRLIIAGFHQDGPRQIDLQDWNWRGLDVINAHERDHAAYMEGMRAAVDAVDSGTIALSRLLTHRLDLDHTGDALDLLDSRPEGFLKAEVML
jgi:2-desacetyl-2-hydroxyethyl bacteriochlorophyllide A dehydrogenase